MQFNKVSEIPQLTRHELNRRIRQERLFDFAQRNGIDCLAYCEPEEEDSALFQEINFNKLQDYEPWYEYLKGTELKKLFSQKVQLHNLAKMKYQSDSDDASQIMAGKKRKRKRYNSGSQDQSKPRNRSKSD